MLFRYFIVLFGCVLLFLCWAFVLFIKKKLKNRFYSDHTSTTKSLEEMIHQNKTTSMQIELNKKLLRESLRNIEYFSQVVEDTITNLPENQIVKVDCEIKQAERVNSNMLWLVKTAIKYTT